MVSQQRFKSSQTLTRFDSVISIPRRFGRNERTGVRCLKSGQSSSLSSVMEFSFDCHSMCVSVLFSLSIVRVCVELFILSYFGFSEKKTRTTRISLFNYNHTFVRARVSTDRHDRIDLAFHSHLLLLFSFFVVFIYPTNSPCS